MIARLVLTGGRLVLTAPSFIDDFLSPQISLIARLHNVIQFLRTKRDASVPGWKRMKILDGLILYRERVRQQSADDLKPLRTKMVEIIQIQRARDGGYDTIEEAVGKINPDEPDVIQAFRRALRKDGLTLNTERAYVSKLKTFMSDRGLTCLADFDRISATDVEAHLTDLAVDGNVAASTQNGAFHALLKSSLWC